MNSMEFLLKREIKEQSAMIEDLRSKLYQERQDKHEAIAAANDMGSHLHRLATGLGLQMTASDLVDYILDNKERLL